MSLGLKVKIVFIIIETLEFVEKILIFKIITFSLPSGNTCILHLTLAKNKKIMKMLEVRLQMVSE